MRLGERIRGDLVRGAIKHFDNEIEGAATAFGVDSDLIRATIFEEQTHLIPLVEGFPAENIGIGRTIGLGQVTEGLGGFSREALLDPALNIQAIATNLFLIGREPLIDPSAPITSIATRYNCGACTSLSSYGRRVYSYYEFYSGTD